MSARPSGWGRAGPVFAGRNILPRAHAPLRTFMVAMTVMCFLAAMAAGGMFMTWQAIDTWKAGVVSEATAQILPLDDSPEEIRKRVDEVVRLLRGTKGIRSVHVLSMEENRALLKPWLGQFGLLDDLPVPRLVAIRLDREHPANIEALDGLIRVKVRGARVDAHGHWVLQLSDMARTAGWLGVAILAGIALAAAILVAWAARAALESNRETIEVLHLVGARDRFIARQVEKRFLRAGFLSALAGVMAAFLIFALLAFVAPSEGIREGAWNMLFGDRQLALRTYVAWAVIVIAATTISLASARTAVIRILQNMFRQG